MNVREASRLCSKLERLLEEKNLGMVFGDDRHFVALALPVLLHKLESEVGLHLACRAIDYNLCNTLVW
jgi:hypothetical protein